MRPIAPLLDEILTAIADALPVKPARQVISPGLPAWDDCGCDDEPGQLALRVTGVNPVWPRNGQGNCEPAMWSISLAISLLQCVATVDDQGNAPSSDMITADGIEMYTAMQLLLSAIVCNVAPLDVIDGDTTIGSWTPLDPQGGCAGGEWSFTVRVL